MRALRGSPSIPAEPVCLAHLADVSNYAISTPGLTEQVVMVGRMAAEGYRVRKIADTIRKRPSRTGRLLHLTHGLLRRNVLRRNCSSAIDPWQRSHGAWPLISTLASGAVA